MRPQACSALSIQKARQGELLSSHNCTCTAPNLCKNIRYNVCRYHKSLESLVCKIAPRTEKKSIAFSLLLVSFYQILFLKIPVAISTDQSVSACDDLKIRKLKGLINACCRALIRKKTKKPQIILPFWLKETIGQHPMAFQEKLLEYFSQEHTYHLRLNALSPQKVDALNLEQHGITPHPSLPLCYLSSSCAPKNIPGFKEGAFYIQSAGAQILAHIVESFPKKELMLDYCAAPGGKCTLLHEQYPKAQIDIFEPHPKRILTIKENALRLYGTDPFSPLNKDEKYDVIVLDVPCSSTGVIGKNPDRMLRSAPNLKKITPLQMRLLKEASALLAPSGIIVYSTCSANPEENEELIKGFLAQSHDFKHMPIKEHPLLFPASHGVYTDPVASSGCFFYASLQKETATSLSTGKPSRKSINKQKDKAKSKK